MSVVFIGLGLNDERGLTIEGLEEARRSGSVFAEFYTNIMPGLDRKKLELLLGKRIVELSRVQLEDEVGMQIVEAVVWGCGAFFIPFCPMRAKSHTSLQQALSTYAFTSKI